MHVAKAPSSTYIPEVNLSWARAWDLVRFAALYGNCKDGAEWHQPTRTGDLANQGTPTLNVAGRFSLVMYNCIALFGILGYIHAYILAFLYPGRRVYTSNNLGIANNIGSTANNTNILNFYETEQFFLGDSTVVDLIQPYCKGKVGPAPNSRSSHSYQSPDSESLVRLHLRWKWGLRWPLTTHYH